MNRDKYSLDIQLFSRDPFHIPLGDQYLNLTDNESFRQCVYICDI